MLLSLHLGHLLWGHVQGTVHRKLLLQEVQLIL